MLSDQDSFNAYLGKYKGNIDNVLKMIKEKDIISRVWKHDYKIWKTKPAEITNRLGWLKSPQLMSDKIVDLENFTNDIRKSGFTNALLLGMGGSSLAPEVFRKTFWVKSGYLDLNVLDSTDPGAVLGYTQNLDLHKTLFIVSTKSGGTVETLSFMKYFYNQIQSLDGQYEAGQQFIAITDPGSSLENLAKDLNFRKVFLNDPNVGGRYSALTYFGLVPAALLGIDLDLLLKRANKMVQDCLGKSINTAAELGTTIGELGNLGKDKITFITSPEIKYFGAWVEQLIAESTGKEGRGVLPVDNEEVLRPEYYGKDRLFIYLHLQGSNGYDKKVEELLAAGFPLIHIHLKDLYDLGGEFFRWELATAIAGWRLDINPFDQPNVESAKILAKKMVISYQKEGKLPELKPAFQDGDLKVYTDLNTKDIPSTIKEFFAKANAGDAEGKNRSYISIQAYLKPEETTDRALHDFRTAIQKKYRMATTVGYGPRFLHSTGQLHKGDSGQGLFLQFLANMPEDIPIPDEAGSDSSSISFGILKTAQCLGDRQALLDAHRKVLLIDLGSDINGNLKRLTDLLK